VVRSARVEAGVAADIRRVVAGIDRELPLHQVRTMTEIVDAAVAARRLQLLLAGGFATAGVLLACLGVFGVVSYGVARRTGEIGVRMALGANRRQVVAMVLKEALQPVIIGLLAGAAVSLAFGRVLASQLYAVSPRDPWVLTGTAVAIALAALAAAFWPARRAACIEPVRALRWE
jgi:putative ABC transport system permease protein